MNVPVRYVGRFDGQGVRDDQSGPATIDQMFCGVGVIVEDPVSFPWHLTDDLHDREPMLVDLTACTDADLAALRTAFEVLTPSDRVVASAGQANELATALDLPSGVFLETMPTDPSPLLDGLRTAKLTVHLLRAGIEPILERELGAGIDSLANDEAPRSSLVHQVGGSDSWLASLVPQPHRFETSQSIAELDPRSCDVLILRTPTIDLTDVELAAGCLVPGGLLIFVLEAATDSPHSLRMGRLVGLLRDAFGSQFLFEHVWGLHERPGRPILGGIVAVRPLGGAARQS